jgi:hypothetical protein
MGWEIVQEIKGQLEGKEWLFLWPPRMYMPMAPF